jgi:hypothetical protein
LKEPIDVNLSMVGRPEVRLSAIDVTVGCRMVLRIVIEKARRRQPSLVRSGMALARLRKSRRVSSLLAEAFARRFGRADN